MATGIVDIHVSKELADHTIVLTNNCEGGLPNDLHLIKNRDVITLQRGSVQSQIRISQEQGTDCAFNYLEVDLATARAYKLLHGSRFRLEYIPGERKLRLRRITISQAYGKLLAEPRKGRDRTLVIGYTLASWLGIPSLPNFMLTLCVGSSEKKLKVEIPNNQLESSFRLTPFNLRKFRLLAGRRWNLEYNQLTHTLRISPQARRGRLDKTSRHLRRG